MTKVCKLDGRVWIRAFVQNVVGLHVPMRDTNAVDVVESSNHLYKGCCCLCLGVDTLLHDPIKHLTSIDLLHDDEYEGVCLVHLAELNAVWVVEALEHRNFLSDALLSVVLTLLFWHNLDGNSLFRLDVHGGPYHCDDFLFQLHKTRPALTDCEGPRRRETERQTGRAEAETGEERMPLTPAYSWEQDEVSATISISLPSSAAASKNTRVECTEAAVKLTCPPYFLQLDLYGNVDDARSKATIESRSVQVVVFKKTPSKWPGLKTDLPSEDAKARRAAASAAKEQRDAAALEDKRERKRQDDDYVFHKQWDLEKDEKRTIERLAAEHKREAERELYKWADDAEGRAAPEGEEELVTYFDKQLVEGGELEVKDGVVPLPGTYHAKTKRSEVVASALSDAPRAQFDIRAGGEKKDKGGEEKASVAEVTEEEEERIAKAERERLEEEERFRSARREQEFEKASKLTEAKEKKAEEAERARKAKEEAEAERKKKAAEEEEKWRETQRRKIKEYEEKKAAKEARAARRAARGEGEKNKKAK
eukprot:CAMPEP_0114110278 /NCGR_PEP_ID=MMETSP0043_2-20121206/1227_1 /TAXON_ID=464988 /ORGANISM="Hemiselmis andersenii, Strain CCMP644" /LENGTH=535 /DNA_ID=CAMNT_0001202217 /DNA_START=1575 /DNA_END=3179 /DNA_ORIENTATION=+